MQHDVKPWYKQLWPWLLIAIPVVTMLKAVHTIVVMQQHSPDMVVDDYYKEGKAINMQLAKYREASLRNLQGAVLVAGNQVVVRFVANDALPEQLNLEFSHATLAAKDFTLTASRSSQTLYAAALPAAVTGKWQLVVSDPEKQWKLRATLTLPTESEIRLGYL